MKARFLWRAYKTRYRDQRAELAAIRSHVTSRDLVCDIGANKGSYLYWMAKWAGRVVAFEPQPGLADYLNKARTALSLNNVVIETAGVSSTSGTLDLYIPTPNSPGASLVPSEGMATMPVRVVALDDYFTPTDKISLLKIDVEGAELDVFKGAERILRESRPVLVFECEQRHCREGAVADCFTYLESRGYRGEFVMRGKTQPVSRFDPALHQASNRPEFWNAPDYCNNFIFRPVI
ncbi:FkbM family methyltransferase [Tardiphaga alba]|uniref:FkbM family methyltransferase n=1 Tax=Tardiphaga alba TaxID=340268 RepID=A0ABX8AD07_9BRAD|nr:FkbM family methyltransferase [Tardiphaga alba]QUS41633.1 FkbM family methyltransferase [Tardiphaga alba]